MAAPELSKSTVAVPIHLDLSDVTNLLNANVPSQVLGEDAWGDLGGGWWIKFSWHREPIGVTANGQTLSARTTVYYHARLAHGVGGTRVEVASCGVGEAEPSLGVGLDVTLAPQPDWSVTPAVSVPAPQVGVRCKLGIINYDVSDRVAGIVRDRFSAQVNAVRDTISARLRFHDQASSAWAQIIQPYKAAEKVYVTLNPSSANLSSLASDPDHKGVTINAGISAEPLIQFDVPPAPVPPSPLPPLVVGPLADLGIHLEVPIEASYDALNNVLNSKLDGRIYPVDKYKARIDSIAVYASDQKVVVQLNISGSAKGRLFIIGDPSVNAVTDQLTLNNVDYTVDTKNLLVKSFSWLMHSELEKVIQSEAKLDFSQQAASAKDAANKDINRSLSPHAEIRGTVTAMTPLGMILFPGSMKAYLRGDGSASLLLH